MVEYCDVIFSEDGHFRGQDLEAGKTYSFPKVVAEKMPSGNLEVEEVSELYEEETEGSNEEDGEGVEICEAEKSNGEVCGREKPCPYHDE